jgi:hypothetical protein
MLIQICIAGENYLQYEAEQAPAIGETVTSFYQGEKVLTVISVDHLIDVEYGGKVTLSIVSVNTRES